MRIASIETLSLAAPAYNGFVDSSFFNTVVRIETNDGLVGWGESEGTPSIIKAMIDAETIHPYAHGLRRLLIGQEIDDVTRLHDLMYEATSYHGRRGAVMGAISAIDMALWDIAGKAANKPVHALFGVNKRDRVPAYVSAYPLGDTADTVRTALDDALAHHPRAIKLCAEASWSGDGGSDKMAEAIRIARKHCGPHMDLMVDMYGAWKRSLDARKALPELAAAHIKWLEAPLIHDDLEGYASLQGFGVPIAAGDLGTTTRFEFTDLLDRGHVDIVQPDLTVAGGFTEVRRISALAAARKRRMVLHHYKSDLLLAANLHVMACEEKTELIEFSLSPSPLRNDMSLKQMQVEEDGCVAVPEGPGLGIDINHETIARFRRAE